VITALIRSPIPGRLGNGATLTIGADEKRSKPSSTCRNGAALGVGREALKLLRGQSWPDAHIDFKVNQAWGQWSTSFVAHEVDATYYQCTGQAISNSAPSRVAAIRTTRSAGRS